MAINNNNKTFHASDDASLNNTHHEWPNDFQTRACLLARELHCGHFHRDHKSPSAMARLHLAVNKQSSTIVSSFIRLTQDDDTLQAAAPFC
jgi:hypothetical protein